MSVSHGISNAVFGVFVSYEIIVAVCEESPMPKTITVMEAFRRIPRHFRSVPIKTAFSLLAPLLITLFHLSLHGEHSTYKWSVLENDISLLPSPTSRALSYMHVHSIYLWKLLFPFFLCYDYGWACISPVLSFADYRNVTSLVAYSSVLFTAYYGATRREAPVLWAGALTIVPFLPASNVLFPVGTIVGERLLYLPR